MTSARKPALKSAQRRARKTAPAKAPANGTRRPLDGQVRAALSSLKQMSTPRDRENLKRFGITANKAFGVSMANMQLLAKRLGRNHELAAALWDTGWYEARMLTSFVDEPARVTAAQMDRWVKDFDNWAICDTLCFHLFDRTRFAWEKARQWASARGEFVKRSAFALMASLAGHDKAASDAQFLALLPLIEQGAYDERNFAKKGVNWALRMVGRRNVALHAAALAVAERLARSEEAACRWVGKDAVRELGSAKVRARLASR